MDLRKKEVAELLTVSFETIDRWIKEDALPTYQWEGECRFNRQELEEWIMKRLSHDRETLPFGESRESGASPWQQFGLYRAIHKGDVFTSNALMSKETIIQETMLRLEERLHFDPDVVASLFLDRENLMSTALASGVAVPHTREFLLHGLFDAVCVVFPKEPMDWGALDGERVHTLFFVFACDDKRHLNLLAKIAHFSSCEENLRFLRSQPDKNTLLEEMRQFESFTKRVVVPC